MNRKTFSLVLLIGMVTLSGCGQSQAPDGGKIDATAKAISEKLAAIQAKGEPVTLEQLDKFYAEPPAGENAAEMYARAFAALTADDPKSPSYVIKNQKALGLLLQAAQRKSCRYPIELKKGYATTLPHLVKVKNSASLLADAANTDAAKGRSDLATRDILAGINLARSLENEPFMISRLVEVAAFRIIVHGLEQSLTRCAFKEGELLELQSALHHAESAADFRCPLLGERACIIAALKMSPEEWNKIMPAMQEIETNLVAYKKSYTYQDDFNNLVDYSTAAINRAGMPFPEALVAHMPSGNPSGQIRLFTLMLLPGIEQSCEKAPEIAARVRVAETAVALERFRIAHGNKLPVLLSELTPALIEAVPTDPFDGQRLRYKKLSRGYVIYSLGKDKIDNSGSTRWPGNIDVTFIIGR